MCHTVIQWMLQRWFTRVAMSFIICNLLYYLIAVKYFVDVSVRGYRLAKIITRRCIERGRRLPRLYCVYATVCTSCVISVTRAGLLDIVDGLAIGWGNVFYDFFRRHIVKTDVRLVPSSTCWWSDHPSDTQCVRYPR